MKKKVCFFLQDAYTGGGLERVVSIVATELSNKYDVVILSLFHSIEKPSHSKFEKLEIVNVSELGPQVSYKKNYLKLKYKTNIALKTIKPDVLVICGMRIYGIAPVVFKKCKTIAWEHSSSFAKNLHAKQGYDFGRKLAKFFADEVIVLTKKDENNFKEKLKFPSKKLHQIYNPMEKDFINKDYNVNSKKIITVGRFHNDKGYDILVDVAKIVYEKHKDWEWHIWGSGNNDLETQIANKIKDYKLDNFLLIKGTTYNLYDLYNDYAMYVMTSRNEGFPMVLIEAHTAKLPIVSFDINCGPDEIIKNEENGYLIEVFDVEQMAEKINYLIENPDVRLKMSKNTKIDKEKLKIDCILEKWINIIDNL